MQRGVAEGHDWLRPTPCTYGSAKQCGQAMAAAHHAPGTKVFTVKGSDLPSLASARGQEMSSTYVRGELRAGGAAALRRLVSDGVLPAAAANVLEEELVRVL